MKVTIKAKVLYHDTLGKLSAGDQVELPESQAQSFIAQGWAEQYETKVIQQKPVAANDPVKPRGRK